MVSSWGMLSCLIAALPGQTTQPFDRDRLDYMKSVFELLPDEQNRRGRERAELDYAAGFGELEGYGLMAWPHRYLDEQTGLYIDHRGCGSWGSDELHGYRQRLLELVEQRGLPENARDLRDRVLEVRGFEVNMPWVALRPLEMSTKAKPVWIDVGPARIGCWPYHGKTVTTYLIHIQGSKQERKAFGTPNRPVKVGYWPRPDVVLVQIDRPHLQLLFFDARYGRILHEYDAEWDRIMREFAAQAARQASTRPAPSF